MRTASIIGLFALIFVLPYKSGYCQSDNFEVELLSRQARMGSSKTTYLSNDEYIMSFKLQGHFTSFLYIQTYDLDGMVSLASYSFEDLEYHQALDDYAVIDNKFYVFYSTYDKTDKAENLFALEINPETAEPILPAKKIMSVNGKFSGYSESSGVGGLKNRVSGKYDFEFDEAGKNIMVRYTFEYGDMEIINVHERFGIHVFNADFEEEWSTTGTMPHLLNKLDEMGMLVDAKGNVFVAHKYTPNKLKLNSILEIVHYSKENTAGEMLQHSFEGLTNIRTVEFKEKKEGGLVIAGVNSDRISEPSLFIFEIDEDGELLSTKQYDVPAELWETHMSSSELKKKQKTEAKGETYVFPELIDLQELQVDNEGNIFVIMEEKPFSNVYGSILIVKINPREDRIEWSKKVPKYQSSYEAACSFKSLITEDDLVVFYFDNAENLDISVDQYPETLKNGKDAVLTAARVEAASGEISYTHLLDLKEAYDIDLYYFSMYGMEEYEEGTMSFEIRDGDEEVWIRVSAK